MANIKQPESLQEAIVYFSDPERAFVHAVNMRWPGGVITCPRCGGTQHSFLKTRLMWFCKGCKRQFSVKVGTIFEDSPISLDKWMTAFWMVVNCKNGISSAEMARTLKITQKSAWFMNHRIREVLGNKSFGLQSKIGGGEGGEVEVDETFVGGKAKFMHRNRAKKYAEIGTHHGKAIVQGFLDRDLREVRAKVVPNTKRETLQDEVLSNVKFGTRVYTDNAVGYDSLHYRFVHEFVNHAERYVNGRVHTNGLENFWSLLKRGLKGTYVAVEPFHLYRYVDEQVFRLNNRKTKKRNVSDADRFQLAMSQINGKRLTYAELTGNGVDSLHTSTAGTREADAF